MTLTKKPKYEFNLAEIEERWLDQIDIRNTSKPESAREKKAIKSAAEIEDALSVIVFGDKRHTLMQCLDALDGGSRAG